MSEIEERSLPKNSDLYKEINNNTPKGFDPDKDNLSTLNSFTSFPSENTASINQSTKENHSDSLEQLSFTENNLNMVTKISQSVQITYNENFSTSSQQEKEISIVKQQELDNTTSIQQTKNEINSNSVQNVSNFEGVVETPQNLFNPEPVVQNQIEMPLPNSNTDIDNNSLAQASIEPSTEPSVKKVPSFKQESFIEQQISTESLFSHDQSPNIGVNYQNNTTNSLPDIKMDNDNNNNLETDDNINSQENDDINLKPFRAKAADHFNVPNANLSAENSFPDENVNPSKNEGNLLGEFGQIPQLSNTPTIEGNIYQSEYEQNVQPNINQTNREPRRWSNNRSPISQFDNEKSDHKGSLNLRKISDAEFQALPSGSRLFLGNLSTHSTSKKELFDIFSPYGEILQISIKNSFGFVQYDNVESVIKAIEGENGRILHGLKLGLEISYSKPWNHSPIQEDGGFKPGFAHRHKKNWNQRGGGHKNAWQQNERELSSPAGRGHGQSFSNRRHNEYERRPNDPKFARRTSYDSRSGYDYPEHKEFRSPQEFRGDFKEDHDYRPREERVFRRGSYREQHREERFKNRSKPYKIPPRDFNERRQSREYPYRSLSHDEPNEEFPLPRRQGNDVPECQIIVLEEVERNFLWQVENAFSEASITVHILHLSRKLHPQSVIRQMVIEGVHAVVFIERHLALNGRVNMQIFDQSRSRDNVKYDEYNNIKVEEAVGFLLRTRISQRPIEMRTADNNLLGQQQNVQQIPPIVGQPVSTNLNHLNPILNSVNFTALANLLGSLQQQQQHQQQQQSAPTPIPAQGMQPIPMIPPGIQPSQQPSLLSQQHPPNIDVQQLLRQLAPQNSGLQNQTPFMSMPQQLAPNLASPQSQFNVAMMSQPPNILPQNAMSSNGIPLSQHQAPHMNPNVTQFSTPITAPANVVDLMAQFKQYSNQH